MEDYKQLIKDPIALRIWNQYFKHANYVLSAVLEPQREEILNELKKKLYENFTIDGAFDDAHRMLDAIETLGQPDEYLKPIISDIILSRILTRYSPINILKKLLHSPFYSFKRFLFSILMGLGYLFLTIVFMFSILKVFIPETGLYLHESGGISIRICSDINSTELLGYWLIPIGITLSLLMYITLTNILKHVSDVKDQ
jgi:hypothetical protein